MKLAISLLVVLGVLCLVTTGHGDDFWEKFGGKVTDKSFGEVIGKKAIPISTDMISRCTVDPESIWTSDCSGDPWNIVYTFSRGDCIEFICIVWDWPGGSLIQDIGILTPMQTLFTIMDIDYGDMSAGNYILGVQVDIPPIAPLGSYDWGTRVRGAGIAGLPPGGPPLPFTIVSK